MCKVRPAQIQITPLPSDAAAATRHRRHWLRRRRRALRLSHHSCGREAHAAAHQPCRWLARLAGAAVRQALRAAGWSIALSCTCPPPWAPLPPLELGPRLRPAPPAWSALGRDRRRSRPSATSARGGRWPRPCWRRQAGRGSRAGHAPAVLRPRCVAGRCVATQRRGARILHAAATGRHQLLHSRLSHADQQQLALLSRLGVAALAGHLI